MSVETKRCPRCELDLPLEEFGICRARKDGLNLYDKLCVRQKINAGRQALREYKAARMKAGLNPIARKPILSPRRVARLLRNLASADRVREAIHCGAETYAQIASVVRLPKDEMDDCLAELLLVRREIRIEEHAGTRRYFIGAPVRKLTARSPREPYGYGVSTVYFAA